jgi:hypothetical protein
MLKYCTRKEGSRTRVAGKRVLVIGSVKTNREKAAFLEKL